MSEHKANQLKSLVRHPDSWTGWDSLWALRDDDGGGQAARAWLTWRFDFIGQPVTVRAVQTQTRLTQKKEKQDTVSLFNDFFFFLQRRHAHLSSSLSVGTLWYQRTKVSSAVNTQFLQDDCSSRI